MKALVLTSPGAIEIIEIDKPECGEGEVLVKMEAAALNKRDQFIREGKYPNIELNSVLGSDGVGEVVELGAGVDKKWSGQKVIINPNRDWGPDKDVQGREYSILGMPSHGTFSEYVKVPAHRVHRMPQGLSSEEAAALPLAGLTAYRACFHHGKITQGAHVLISGFGGGVAQFAFQFSIAVGAKVYVTSGRPEKINMALDMGAAGGFNYKLPNWYKNPWQTKGGFDVVIDSAGGDQVNSFLKIMRPGGRVVFYGATNGLPSSIDLYRMFWNQITLQGSTMGNDTEFVEMLRFVEKHDIKPLLSSVKPFDDIVESFNEIAKPSKMGKVVVKF